MARSLGLLFLSFLLIQIVHASVFHPISESHRSVAAELFKPVKGSFESLGVAYHALRTFEILNVEKAIDISASTCPKIVKNLQSSSADLKDVFYSLKCNQYLKCSIDNIKLKNVASRLQSAINGASSLLDYYHAVGSLVLLKHADVNVELSNIDAVYRSIKSLGQSDGRWRYNANNPKSSYHAAGIAFDTLAGVTSLAASDTDQSLIGSLKSDIEKLFGSIEKYDDGAMYFDDEIVGDLENEGPVLTTSAVLQGVMAVAGVTSGKINVPGEKILGLAKFFLGLGTPGYESDFFNQLNSLALLENNKLSIPLILSLQANVLSLTKNDQLRVRVNTVLGSSAPPLTVKIVKAKISSAKGGHVIDNQELQFDSSSGVHVLGALPKSADVGIYEFVFKVAIQEPDHSNNYVVEESQEVIYVTGAIGIDSADVAILDSDHGNVDSQNKLDVASKSTVSLSANHLQKFRLSFQLSTPLGNAFEPHQALLKLKHETKVEHVFLVGNSGEKFELILDFLGLVDKLYYLSGRYDLELLVGDSVMENSFLWSLGHVELELPEAPEKAARPPPQAVDPYSRYGPKSEISHIFRVPEKRPSTNLSLAFLGLTFLPLVGFVFGLQHLGVNLKKFPTSGAPSIFAILFHLGMAAVLGLYALFWLKLNLFTTLKLLGFLGVFLVFTGHGILSHLASASGKLKST